MPLRHYHRKLDAGFVALPQMTGRRFGMPFILSPPTLTLRFRQNNGPTPSGDYQPSRSLSMAGSEGELYGKGRLVLAVVKRHIENNPSISYSVLEQAFPKKCQGFNGVFLTKEKAIEKAETGRKRHFISLDEVIEISGTFIAVSSQWGIGNINKFIKRASELGYSIEMKKG